MPYSNNYRFAVTIFGENPRVFAFCTKTKRFVYVLLPTLASHLCLHGYYNKLYQKNQHLFSEFVLTAQKYFYNIKESHTEKALFFAKRFA